ncbi:hypothetical protein SAMN04488243_10398 [Thermus arciformis]|uniref:Uncharacterized protein n=1 Tax=Thermus arciformis TaxID=482827 RepID=A0A1G7DRQ0_9DEIN|nr:hypothetical protein [Thermus arciformis]SDE54179.1 hypothetical protein SAMN04488243_10398 [Thermus arciformis]
MRQRGLWVALYLLLTLAASTGVALQMYLMRVQNPGLGADLCQAPGEDRPLEHSPLCGLQVAPGLPPVAEPAPPTLLHLLKARPASRPGHAPLSLDFLAPRAPPFALA